MVWRSSHQRGKQGTEMSVNRYKRLSCSLLRAVISGGPSHHHMQQQLTPRYLVVVRPRVVLAEQAHPLGATVRQHEGHAHTYPAGQLGGREVVEQAGGEDVVGRLHHLHSRAGEGGRRLREDTDFRRGAENCTPSLEMAADTVPVLLGLSLGNDPTKGWKWAPSAHMTYTSASPPPPSTHTVHPSPSHPSPAHPPSICLTTRPVSVMYRSSSEKSSPG